MAVVDLLELPVLLAPYAPLAGLDLGEKTIGVAVSDATRTVATPLQLIRKTKFTDDAKALFKLMESRGAVGGGGRHRPAGQHGRLRGAPLPVEPRLRPQPAAPEGRPPHRLLGRADE